MKFGEQFPSLWGLWQPKARYSENDEPLQVVSGEFILSDLQKHCLDKAKVKKAMNEILERVEDLESANGDESGFWNTSNSDRIEELLKELGLEVKNDNF